MKIEDIKINTYRHKHFGNIVVPVKITHEKVEYVVTDANGRLVDLETINSVSLYSFLNLYDPIYTVEGFEV